MRFVPKVVPFHSESAFDQEMGWRQTGYKQLPDPIMPSPLIHACMLRQATWVILAIQTYTAAFYSKIQL